MAAIPFPAAPLSVGGLVEGLSPHPAPSRTQGNFSRFMIAKGYDGWHWEHWNLTMTEMITETIVVKRRMLIARRIA